jgi:hypothetical protein
MDAIVKIWSIKQNREKYAQEYFEEKRKENTDLSCLAF